MPEAGWRAAPGRAAGSTTISPAPCTLGATAGSNGSGVQQRAATTAAAPSANFPTPPKHRTPTHPEHANAAAKPTLVEEEETDEASRQGQDPRREAVLVPHDPANPEQQADNVRESFLFRVRRVRNKHPLARARNAAAGRPGGHVFLCDPVLQAIEAAGCSRRLGSVRHLGSAGSRSLWLFDSLGFDK